MKRIFELWVGNQASGKTFQLRKRIAALAARPTVRSVLIVDRLGELGDVADVVCRSVAEFNEAARDGLPRVVSFQMGLAPLAYLPVYDLAVWEGDCVLVLDEARAVAPAGSAWKGGDALERIAFAGRHLPNALGELRPTHMLVATQYPRSIHITIREQARTVMAGTLSGENAYDWVRGEFGPQALERVQRLGQWEWTALRGKDPR